MDSLGIDVGGSSVKLALVHDGDTVWQTQSETYNKPSPQELAAAIRKAVDGRFPSDAVAGICVPGLRDAGGRTVLMDFGTAEADSEFPRGLRGTPAYLAPEVLAGGAPSLPGPLSFAPSTPK